MTTAILFLRLFLAAHPAPSPAPAHRHVGGPAILVLDMSTPDGPSSEFPTIVSKGRL